MKQNERKKPVTTTTTKTNDIELKERIMFADLATRVGA